VANGVASKTAQTSETVAVGCDQLPIGAHGKEGSTVRVRQRASSFPLLSRPVVLAGGVRERRRPRSVHQRPPWTLSRAQLVEQADRMLASVGRGGRNGGRSWSGWRPCSGRGRRPSIVRSRGSIEALSEVLMTAPFDSRRRSGMEHPSGLDADASERVARCCRDAPRRTRASADGEGGHRLLPTSRTASANAPGASWGRLCPMPPSIVRCEYGPANFAA
jgi:hypothetical protein